MTYEFEMAMTYGASFEDLLELAGVTVEELEEV